MVLGSRALGRLELKRDKLLKREQWIIKTEREGECTMALLSAKKELGQEMEKCLAALHVCRAQSEAAEQIISAAQPYVQELLREHYCRGKSWVLLSDLDGYNTPDALRKTATRYLARESWKR